MSKELDKLNKMSDETKYEFNVYARELGKDLTNLMELLRQQDKDNKPILYAGKHIKRKVILPYEEYQKMQQALIELQQLREFDRFCSMGKSIQYCKNEVIK